MHKHILAAAALCAVVGAAQATPITVNTPFFNLEIRGPNSLGINTNPLVRFGAASVTPNGSSSNGTTGVAVRNSDGLTRTLNFAPFPLGPNWFERYLNDSAGIRGAWTLTFTNGTDTKSVPIFLDPAAVQAKIVESITLSGDSQTPTFTWAPKPGETPNGYRVNLLEKTATGTSGTIASINLTPDKTSYTVKASDFTLPAFKFKDDGSVTYVIEISSIRTKNGGSTLADLNNGNIEAIARAYADFTPNKAGGPIVHLPVVQADGSYLFDIAVAPGVTYYIDPDVAVGYDYEIGVGNPNFLSVDLPDAIGDGLYDIFGFDSGGNSVLLAHNWKGTDVFDFGAGGVGKFRVMGIETSAALDPNNTTAFITGLTFSGPGQFTGTQTPITVTIDGTVPEPSGLALAGLGLLALLRRRRSH